MEAITVFIPVIGAPFRVMVVIALLAVTIRDIQAYMAGHLLIMDFMEVITAGIFPGLGVTVRTQDTIREAIMAITAASFRMFRRLSPI